MTTPIDPTVDYNKYIDFVDSTTSFPSKDAEEFVARIYDLKEKGVNLYNCNKNSFFVKSGAMKYAPVIF